jgi:hypothetical protein
MRERMGRRMAGISGTADIDDGQILLDQGNGSL